MNLLQYITENGQSAAAVHIDGTYRHLTGLETVYGFAADAIRRGLSLEEAVEQTGLGDEVDAKSLYAEGRLRSPVDHPDPARLMITGTGLTHLGSASARDAMHGGTPGEHETDTMRMFRWGLEGGKPNPGETGVQPEWFFKGNGYTVTPPGLPIHSPSFAEDAGEEPEIAGIYLIDDQGCPVRLGFALANEFSDHVMERRNYLYLAHSKLRTCSYGPELFTESLPQDIRGQSKIIRGDADFWSREFLTGEANMSHTIANLEHHHFKYPMFRQPGDLHIHMFGTATLSFADNINLENGDIMEVEAEPFGLPLRNPLVLDTDPPANTSVRTFSKPKKESTS